MQRVVVVVMALVVELACEKNPRPKQALNSRLLPVCTLDVECGERQSLWSGPDNAAVHVELVAASDCAAALVFVDKHTGAETPAGVRVGAGRSDTDVVKVPGTQILTCKCEGDGDAHCSCRILGVDPPLPAGVTLAPPQLIPPGQPSQTDPAVAPPNGTPIKLTCGKEAPLWDGPNAYVTVTFKGPGPLCRASVKMAGSTATTDERPFTQTFGPTKSLKAVCEGRGTDTCDFQITATVQVP